MANLEMLCRGRSLAPIDDKFQFNELRCRHGNAKENEKEDYSFMKIIITGANIKNMIILVLCLSITIEQILKKDIPIKLLSSKYLFIKYLWIFS
jgi:hypothetical protein